MGARSRQGFHQRIRGPGVRGSCREHLISRPDRALVGPAPLIATAYTLHSVPVLLDVLYGLVGLLTAPIWLVRMALTGKLRTDWPARFGRVPTDARPKGRPRILLHAVSVGEVNAIRQLVAALRETPEAPEVIVASTTDTGFARAQAVFPDLPVIRYPFDFSWSVRRVLDAIEPDVVGLVELEVWPNFTAACHRRGIPLAVVNGRLSARSFARYRRVAACIRPMFRRLDLALVQNADYAERFTALGAEPVVVAGTMKWDTARLADGAEGADGLAADLGIDRNRPLVVAGSTAPDEHRLLHEATPDGVQLLCAPRKPEWFDRAARDLPGCARRSAGTSGSSTGRFLLDTIGELRAAYALADVVVVGRTFGDLHGSDMIEPIALGRPTVVGPAVSDFADIAEALLAGGGLLQTDRTGLAGLLTELLGDADRRRALGAAGRAVIRSHQGATARHVEQLRALLPEIAPRRVNTAGPKNSPPRQ